MTTKSLQYSPALREGLSISGMFGRREHWLYLLLAIAIVFGGGGVGFGLFNAVVQVSAILVLALRPDILGGFVRRAPRALVILALATLALPLLQLVPLPPAIWQALPGRELVFESMQVLGQQDGWVPFTVDPNRTALVFAGLLPPLAVLALAWNLDNRGSLRLLAFFAGIGLCSVLLGAFQLYSGNTFGNWYPGGWASRVYGTFANHNSTGVFLVICLMALSALPVPRRNIGFQIAWRSAAGLILAIGVLLTQSRSSTTLLIVPAGALAMRAFRSLKDRRRSWGRGRLGWLAALAIALAAAGALYSNDKVQQTVTRFSDLSDARPAIWENAVIAMERYWPAGSGMGTFDEVYQVDEFLENVSRLRAGRAHNDVLELSLEAGVAGLVLLVAWLAWLGLQAVKKARPAAPVHFAASAGLFCIMLQSLIDYPLRNEALLCVAAALVALLARPAVGKQTAVESR